MSATPTPLAHRITSLERWGLRMAADFQPAGLKQVAQAGFTGVLVNGGSGIGPDMLTPELLLQSPVLPDLAPRTVQAAQVELRRRCDLLRDAGLEPWLCVWGVSGPDESAGNYTDASNRFFDRRTKMELRARLRRDPEIFGHRDPRALNWRGSRPLCVSHPQVQHFYRDLYSRLVREYGFKGIFFFPGDLEPELCDANCPRCMQAQPDIWQRMITHVNDLFASAREADPAIPFYFTLWNQSPSPGLDGRSTIDRVLDSLHPRIGMCMAMTDIVVQQRRSGRIAFSQPWSMIAEPGELFVGSAAKARAAGRPIMVLAEISQSEVWDPVAHNVPLPAKIIRFLRSAANVTGVNAMLDFWGHRGPFVSHANHAAMHAWSDAPEASPEAILRQAAGQHYGLPIRDLDSLHDKALACWSGLNEAVDQWAIGGWTQRFSYAIGRPGARGTLYQPLLPHLLRGMKDSLPMRMMQNAAPPAELGRLQLEDRVQFLTVAERFDDFAAALAKAGLPGDLPRREAVHIRLIGELIGSMARTLLAYDAAQAERWEDLRSIVQDEIDARERQLLLSGEAGPGCGVDPLFVPEDIGNMRMLLSSHDYPHTPASCFEFTLSPYTV